jgi:hypothetical protein
MDKLVSDIENSEVASNEEDSSHCTGRFRTIVEEEGLKGVSTAGSSKTEALKDNTGTNQHESQVSITEHLAAASGQNAADVVWKKFRLLSVIILVQFISDPSIKRCQECGKTGRYDGRNFIELSGPRSRSRIIFCKECNSKLDNISLDEWLGDSSSCRAIIQKIHVVRISAPKNIEDRHYNPHEESSHSSIYVESMTERVYLCGICGGSFDCEDRWIAHMIAHHDVRPYPCPGDCGINEW